MTDYSDEQLTLFELPLGLDCSYVGFNGTPRIVCAKRLPLTANHVGTVKWHWSPAHSRIDVYRLSTNRGRSRWILWLRLFDDIKTRKWKDTVYTYGPKKGVSAKTAAFNLLFAGWQSEIAESGSDLEHFHMVTAEGLLSAEELYALADQVWSRVG